MHRLGVRISVHEFKVNSGILLGRDGPLIESVGNDMEKI